ncbi:uncharacterized protein BDV17DRAFT_267908 [Aspergillus undulatus]|uniref:uncharacterized protein n=1 Tax=Aspergillus undulatus TaxID=1810928 RepID=UPI003CCD9AD6
MIRGYTQPGQIASITAPFHRPTSSYSISLRLPLISRTRQSGAPPYAPSTIRPNESETESMKTSPRSSGTRRSFTLCG